MSKFRKRLIEIDAMQWTEDVSMRELTDFTNGLVQLNDADREFLVYDRLHDTWISFEYGDWIIKGVQGEFYPCKPDVFTATYTPTDTMADQSDTSPADTTAWLLAQYAAEHENHKHMMRLAEQLSPEARTRIARRLDDRFHEITGTPQENADR